MSASISISVPDLQSLVADQEATFNLTSVTLKEIIVMELLAIQDGEVHVEVLRKDVSAVMAFLVDNGICFKYVS